MWPFRRNMQDLEAAEQASLDAQKQLRRVNARDIEVHKISGSLRTLRERNHFAENLRSIMQGG